MHTFLVASENVTTTQRIHTAESYGVIQAVARRFHIRSDFFLPSKAVDEEDYCLWPRP